METQKNKKKKKKWNIELMQFRRSLMKLRKKIYFSLNL